MPGPNNHISSGDNASPIYAQKGPGIQTLETLEDAHNYNSWIASLIQPHLGLNNIEVGAGTGTISNYILRDHNVALFDTSDYNQNSLAVRFKNSPHLLKVESDFLQECTYNHWNCVYSSNVLEHIENDCEIIAHAGKLLTHGGKFVALVPAHQFLYSKMDQTLGHHRRYTQNDIHRISNFLVQAKVPLRIESYQYLNPIGAIGWFIKMKILGQKSIKPSDALLMNQLIPYLKHLDRLRLPFGQSLLIVLKKDLS